MANTSSSDTTQFQIRQMSADDLPLCRALVQQAGWNQTDLDWLRAIKLAPTGCFVAEINGEGVATTTTCCFDSVAWIAMVLVDHNHRGAGIALRLVTHAIRHVENLGVKCISLDATAMGQPLYEKLGFRAEYEVIRYVGTGKQTRDFSQNQFLKRIYPDEAAFDHLTSLDFKITGTNRRSFISNLIENDNTPFYGQFNDQGQIIGYSGSRNGANAQQLGPAVALTDNAGHTLLDRLLSDFAGQRCYIDIPIQNTPATNWAQNNAFLAQRTFVRMYRGEKSADQPALIWASSGPEKG
jgi:predicted N-acetyltransferase YhbS